jgi:hypothetical protein
VITPSENILSEEVILPELLSDNLSDGPDIFNYSENDIDVSVRERKTVWPEKKLVIVLQTWRQPHG